MPLNLNYGLSASTTAGLGFETGVKEYEYRKAADERAIRQQTFNNAITGMRTAAPFLLPYINQSIRKQDQIFETQHGFEKAKQQLQFMRDPENVRLMAEGKVQQSREFFEQSRAAFDNMFNPIRNNSSEAGVIQTANGPIQVAANPSGEYTLEQIQQISNNMQAQLEQAGMARGRPANLKTRFADSLITLANGQQVLASVDGNDVMRAQEISNPKIDALTAANKEFSTLYRVEKDGWEKAKTAYGMMIAKIYTAPNSTGDVMAPSESIRAVNEEIRKWVKENPPPEMPGGGGQQQPPPPTGGPASPLMPVGGLLDAAGQQGGNQFGLEAGEDPLPFDGGAEQDPGSGMFSVPSGGDGPRTIPEGGAPPKPSVARDPRDLMAPDERMKEDFEREQLREHLSPFERKARWDKFSALHDDISPTDRAIQFLQTEVGKDRIIDKVRETQERLGIEQQVAKRTVVEEMMPAWADVEPLEYTGDRQPTLDELLSGGKATRGKVLTDAGERKKYEDAYRSVMGGRSLIERGTRKPEGPHETNWMQEDKDWAAGEAIKQMEDRAQKVKEFEAESLSHSAEGAEQFIKETNKTALSNKHILQWKARGGGMRASSDIGGGKPTVNSAAVKTAFKMIERSNKAIIEHFKTSKADPKGFGHLPGSALGKLVRERDAAKDYLRKVVQSAKRLETKPLHDTAVTPWPHQIEIPEAVTRVMRSVPPLRGRRPFDPTEDRHYPIH